MIKNKIREKLLEYHDIQKKKSSLMNLKASVQSLADAVRYIESSCEEIDDPKLVQQILKLKNKIMTDSGVGAGFDENTEPDILSKLKDISHKMDEDLKNLHKKNNLPEFF